MTQIRCSIDVQYTHGYHYPMAKKQAHDTEEKPKRGKPYGLYLDKDMAADVERIAAKETDGNTHALLQFAVRYFIKEYDSGSVKLKRKTVTRLSLD
jgi:hypothetical protein